MCCLTGEQLVHYEEPLRGPSAHSTTNCDVSIFAARLYCLDLLRNPQAMGWPCQPGETLSFPPANLVVDDVVEPRRSHLGSA